MRNSTSNLSSVFVRGFRWWTSELGQLVPRSLRADGTRAGADRVLIVKEGRIVDTIPRLATAQDEPALMDAIAARARKGRLRVRIRVPASDCYIRPITVPKAAMRDIERIASLELERTTPFRSDDVLSAVAVDGDTQRAGFVTAQHIVLKRRTLNEIEDRLRQYGVEIVGIDCYRERADQPLAIDFLKTSQSGTREVGGALLPSTGVLAASLAAVLLLTLAVQTYKHEQALAGLREQTAALRERVAAARRKDQSAASATGSLWQLKAQHPPAVLVLDDLTRRVPDSAFVTQFRFADGVVELGGYGRPVRNLAPELELSPFIETASITAPVVTDEKLQKERFDLRMILERDDGAEPTTSERAP